VLAQTPGAASNAPQNGRLNPISAHSRYDRASAACRGAMNATILLLCHRFQHGFISFTIRVVGFQKFTLGSSRVVNAF
jgi:hypothetical protein